MNTHKKLITTAVVLSTMFISSCSGVITRDALITDCISFRSESHYEYCKRLRSIGALPDYKGLLDDI